MKAERLIPILTYAGAIPFVAPFLFAMVGPRLPLQWPVFVPMVTLAAFYWGLIILNFMAGTVWGMAVTGSHLRGGVGEEKRSLWPLLLGSNAIAIVSWVNILTPYQSPLYMAFGFLALLPLDRIAQHRGLISDNYYRLRMTVTGIVVASLLGLWMLTV